MNTTGQYRLSLRRGPPHRTHWPPRRESFYPKGERILRAAIGSTILIATLAGPLVAQAKSILGVASDRTRPHDVNAKLVASRAARFVAAVQARSVIAASAPVAQPTAWPASAQIVRHTTVFTDAMLAAKVHDRRPVVLRL